MASRWLKLERRLKLGRSDDAHNAGSARFQLCIRSQEPALQYSCQSKVLGVVGLGPPQTVGDPPRFFYEALGPSRADCSNRQPFQRDVCELAGDFLAPPQFV